MELKKKEKLGVLRKGASKQNGGLLALLVGETNKGENNQNDLNAPTRLSSVARGDCV